HDDPHSFPTRRSSDLNVTYRGITVDALTRQAGRLPIRDGGTQVGAGFDANGNGLSLLEGVNYVMEDCTVKNFGHPYYIGHSENIDRKSSRLNSGPVSN